MPFQKGQSGNPKGRPRRVVEDAKQSVLTTLFDEAAERDVVKAMIEGAKRRDVAAATWLWDRKYGKVKEKVEHSGGVEHFYVDIGGSDDGSDSNETAKPT